MLLPLNHKVKLRGDFTGVHFTLEGKPQFETLIKLTINERQFHFFVCSANKNNYLVIDTMSKMSLDEFQRTANSILLSYAFLKGNYHGEEGYFFTYSDKDFRKPESMLSVTLGGGIYNGFPVHSSSPHSVISIKEKTKYRKDKSAKIIGLNDDHLKKYMVEFPAECLSKMCELICNKGGILRAVILFVSNHSTTLEMKIPILFVALENITKVLIGGDKATPKIIDDDKILRKIKAAIRIAVKEIEKIQTENTAENLSIEDLKEYKASFARIIGKLNDFNKGTNNKKLVEPFVSFGYQLSEEENDLIFTHRNKFLHGDDFMTLDESYEIEFKELFHMSMRLHKLISVLLLKATDYEGYILNNAKIYDYISERTLDEEVFVKI